MVLSAWPILRRKRFSQKGNEMTIRNFLYSAVSVLASLSAAAFDVSVLGKDGKPVDSGPLCVKRHCRTEPSGIKTIRVELRSELEGEHYANVVASLNVTDPLTVWDGKKDRKMPSSALSQPLLSNGAFLMGAAWNGSNGTALALGADDLPSFADFTIQPSGAGATLKISVPAAFMRKGASFTCTFHAVPFSPKYGIRDALARYYPLYPSRFKKDSRVNPAVYGASAEYACWKEPDPERCRMMNATWEWCHGAGRSWGDPLSQESLTGKINDDYSWSENLRFSRRDWKYQAHTNWKLSCAEFNAVQSARLANSLYCGVVNGFYMMAVANISDVIAKRYPDSVAVGETCAPNDYPYSTEVYTFPECSWGMELRRQLAALVKKHDLGAIAFDVSRPRSVYRGERLKEMDNVGRDEHGAGVVRGIGSGKLFDYIHTLKNKTLSGNCGVIVNSKYEHLSDMLHMDTMMIELNPWSREPPFPLSIRYGLGEKGLTLWEGYTPRAFAPDFNNWNREDKHLLISDLSRYAVHRSLVAGASLPAGYITEYASLASKAFAAMNSAGWKAVPGAEIDGQRWELARYGSGTASILAVCNETNLARRAKLTVYPEEIASDRVGGLPPNGNGYLFVPMFGGTADIRCHAKGGEFVSCDVGSLLFNALECVGTLEGSGSLAANWNGDCDALRLIVKSIDYSGAVRLKQSFGAYALEGDASRTIAAGGQVEAVYRNVKYPGLGAEVRRFTFTDARRKCLFTLAYANDPASKDMADRMDFFFWRAMGKTPDKAMRKKIGKRGRKPFVASAVDETLDPLTVVIRSKRKNGGAVTVSAKDREELSEKVKYLLGVIHAEHFPEYGHEVKMSDQERRCYPLWFKTSR